MTVSHLIIRPLADFVCGDSKTTPYLTGPSLVELFRKYGFNDVYEAGFPSRWAYTQDKIEQLNGTDTLVKLIEDIIDPRRFIGTDKNHEVAIEKAKELLKFDGYDLFKSSNSFKVVGAAQEMVDATTSQIVNHAFITEQIVKAKKKIEEGDYNGAITNARSLVEAVCIQLIEQIEGIAIKNDGNIDNLWARTKKAMKLQMDKQALPDSINQILSGLDTSVKGLAGLSNTASDRHANNFNTRKHHAKLAVNLSLALSDFLFESLEYQMEKQSQ